MNISFVIIPVNSLDETIKFYKDVMDFEVVNRFPAGPQSEIAFISDKKGNQLELIQTGGETIQHNSMISLGFFVEDINQTLEHLSKHAVQILDGPTAMPSGVSIIHAKDLNGVTLTFVQRPEHK